MSAILAALVAALLSVPGGGRRLVILTYHRIVAERDPLRPDEPSAGEFDAQMAALRGAFNVLRLDEALARLREGRLPLRAVAVTFDDGYRDNHAIALPILERHGVPATFFVATGFLRGGAMFNDVVIEAIRRTDRAEIPLPGSNRMLPLNGTPARREAIGAILREVKGRRPAERERLCSEIASALGAPKVERLMMTPEDVRDAASRGVEIGAHTVSHPILCALEIAQAKLEIADSKHQLESLVDRPVVGFAYPNGRPKRDYAAEHVQLVREAGFGYAVSTRWASVWPQTPHFELPRIAPWERSGARFAMRVARSFANR